MEYIVGVFNISRATFHKSSQKFNEIRRSVLRRATTSRCHRTSGVVRLVYLRYNINTGSVRCGNDKSLG